MPQYHRLNVNEREEISLGLAQGRSRRDIAYALGRYPSTISREISRNNNRAARYRAIKSQTRADDHAHNTIRRTRKLETCKPLKEWNPCAPQREKRGQSDFWRKLKFIRNASQKSGIMGSKKFIDKITDMVGRDVKLKERGRPRKSL